MNCIRRIGLTTIAFSFAVASVAAEKKPLIPENGSFRTALPLFGSQRRCGIPIYGEELIAGEKPYRATLRGDTWTVTGSLPEGFEDGAAIAEISKRDGRILRVSRILRVIHDQ